MPKRETIVVVDSENNLYLSKNKAEKNSGLFLIFGMPLLFAIMLFWLLPKVKPNLKIDFEIIAFLILLSIYIVVFYFNMVIKILKNRNCILTTSDNNVIVNKKILCKQNELVSVIIRPIVDNYGLGMSYTVGLDYGKKSVPLTFFHCEKNAKTIADKIAKFYSISVTVKRPFQFSFFRKW